jgi:hypothetical protein
MAPSDIERKYFEMTLIRQQAGELVITANSSYHMGFTTQGICITEAANCIVTSPSLSASQNKDQFMRSFVPHMNLWSEYRCKALTGYKKISTIDCAQYLKSARSVAYHAFDVATCPCSPCIGPSDGMMECLHSYELTTDDVESLRAQTNCKPAKSTALIVCTKDHNASVAEPGADAVSSMSSEPAMTGESTCCTSDSTKMLIQNQLINMSNNNSQSVAATRSMYKRTRHSEENLFYDSDSEDERCCSVGDLAKHATIVKWTSVGAMDIDPNHYLEDENYDDIQRLWEKGGKAVQCHKAVAPKSLCDRVISDYIPRHVSICNTWNNNETDLPGSTPSVLYCSKQVRVDMPQSDWLKQIDHGLPIERNFIPRRGPRGWPSYWTYQSPSMRELELKVMRRVTREKPDSVEVEDRLSMETGRMQSINFHSTQCILKHRDLPINKGYGDSVATVVLKSGKKPSEVLLTIDSGGIAWKWPIQEGDCWAMLNRHSQEGKFVFEMLYHAVHIPTCGQFAEGSEQLHETCQGVDCNCGKSLCFKIHCVEWKLIDCMRPVSIDNLSSTSTESGFSLVTRRITLSSSSLIDGD